MQITKTFCDCCGADCSTDNMAQSFYGGFWPNLVPYLCGECRKAAKDALLKRAVEGTAVANAEKHRKP